ncbi:histidine kinase [Streptomyces sp. NPDC050549]|uniref:sensor histidine kinase n=1 Tax=Streptomyces sp. NPDC050549 TaxID=3155406 RepID=UPI0034223882
MRGVLQVSGLPGRPAFGDAVVAMIAGFANQAALALEIAEHRRAAEQLLIAGDRDRIAGDLHDLAVQRLFAAGLSLRSLRAQCADRPPATERIEGVVDDLDEAIKIIRSTVRALTPHDTRTRTRTGTGLRTRLVAETGRASAVLGFSPALRMTGRLDTQVADDLADQLIAVLREALTRTAQHAHASTVDVAAEATATHLTLRVAADGHGIDPTRARSSVPAGLHARATELGGTLTLAPRLPTGTTLEWTVPLPADG